MTSYRVRTGFHYPASAADDAELRAIPADASEADRQAVLTAVHARGGFKRAEPGDVVRDLPEGSIPWLLEQGVIEEARIDPDQPSEVQPGEVDGPLGPDVTPIVEEAQRDE